MAVSPFVISLFAALSGCGPRITNANIDVVNAEFQVGEKTGKGGVSPKEVESILGQPARIETKMLPLETQKKEVEVTRYYYQQDGGTVELHFFDNKLIARVPHLDAKTASAPAKSTPAP